MKQTKKLYILRALFLFIVLIGVYGSGNAQTKNTQNLSSDEYFRLAKIEANQKGNYPLAVSYCKKSLKESPDNMDVHLLLGKCYLEIENYDSARYELKKVADAYPHSVDSRHYLINVEYKTGRYSSAICYINELLEVRPYSRTLWLKKVSIYNDMGNTVEAKRALTRLFSIYPTDTMVKNAYQELILNEAARYYKNGNFSKSSELLTKALEANPRDLLTLHQQVNNFLSAGKRSDAMGLIESGLSNFPGDPILIEKKIGVLEEMGNYQDALAFTQATMKKYPSAKLRTLANDLQLQAAEFYMNNDPYVLYQKIYATNPGNEEAFTYLLNNSLTKGYYSDAEEYIKIALKRSPNNKVVLLKQLTLFELEHKTAEANKAIEKLVTMFPSDGELQDKYSTILLAQAKGYFQDQLYTQAQPLFEKLMRFPDMISTANDYLYSIQLAQKNYSAALILINKQIARYPRDENYVFKKASLLEEMGKYDDAIEITNRLTKKNPTNSLYKQSFISQSIPYIKQLMEDEKYDSAMIVIDRLLENDGSH